jgi:hypothetical protein
MRTRLRIGLVSLSLMVVSCGGGAADDDSVSSPESASDTPETMATVAGGETTAPAEESVTDDSGAGQRTATIAIDGEALTYDLDDLTFSNVEGVDDLTFETCDPDFFGSGRFYAIGYAVEADGKLLLGDDGMPVAAFTMDLPPDDWQETERDAPTFEINRADLSIDIASPEEAGSGEMAWTIDGTTASGTAVFIDFENTYTVEFEVVCESSATVPADVPASGDGDDDGEDGTGGLSGAAAGVGSFTVDGESFDDVEVFSCPPFSASGEPDPGDLSLLGFLGVSTGLEVVLAHSQGVDTDDGTPYDRARLDVFHSRQGASGVEQFEASAANDADGNWFLVDSESLEETPLDAVPYIIDGARMSGSLAGLEQTFPDEGAATVDVTWDYEIPAEITEGC